MPPDLEQTRRLRDRRLRRRLLTVLHASRGGPDRGYIGGELLRDLYGDQAVARERCESDEHLIALMRDLVNHGLAEERDGRTRKSEPYALDTLDWRITARGVGLIEESVPPVPDVDDERIA